MDKIELIGLIARIRRNQPRNIDVMRICEELERLVTKPAAQEVTKPAESDIAKPFVTGRPPLGERAMTPAERMRRYRERQSKA